MSSYDKKSNFIQCGQWIKYVLVLEYDTLPRDCNGTPVSNFDIIIFWHYERYVDIVRIIIDTVLQTTYYITLTLIIQGIVVW